MTEEKETCNCGKEANTAITDGKDSYPCCWDCRKKHEEEELFKKIEPAIRTICDELNHMGMEKNAVQAMFQAITHQHRYLQNEFFIALYKLFKLYGDQTEGQYDPRNEWAVKAAKKWHDLLA